VTEEELPPIDGKAWMAYIRGGRAHFERVQRSWVVFWRNANDLLGLLHSVETNAVASLMLMQAPRSGQVDVDEFHEEFWAALDQRLHNLVAAAVSLIDHTRPLIAFYEHEPAFRAEFERRNDAVRLSPRASFVRALRNYLVHYGVAPLMQTMTLRPTTSEDWDELRIKLSAQGLLRWEKWNQQQRAYLENFEDGPPLRDEFKAYVEDMRDVYNWLFQQHAKLHPPGEIPEHLKVGRANHVMM
jgi:hypothetical protein